MAKKSKIAQRSGNIFADLGLESSQEHYAKARLAIFIGKTIAARKLTQGQAASKIGLRQPDVSKLLRGRIDGFSLERLLNLVRALGSDVEIKIKPSKPKREGCILVAA
jgi:predicted XRE-type DNA-binding protein